MPAPAIRLFRNEDGEALADLHRRAIIASGNTSYTGPELESWAGQLTADGYANAVANGEIIAVATNETGKPVGFCSWDAARIKGMYVDPDRQGEGIGAALLAHGENALRERGITRSEIVSSLPGRGFYEAHGYAPVHTDEHKTRGGLVLPVVVLAKEL